MLDQVKNINNERSEIQVFFFCLKFSGGFRPVRELADRMNVIIHEYYDSGEVAEAIRCLKELNVPHFFHEFVYELMDFCLEKNTERLVTFERDAAISE